MSQSKSVVFSLTSRNLMICSKAESPSVFARTPDKAGPGVPANIVGETAAAPGVTGVSASV